MMMFKNVIFTLIILSSISCAKPEVEPYIEAKEKKYSFLALGDSYTIGQNVSNRERWPIQLKSKINEEKIVIKDVTIIARTGWTTRDLSEAISSQNPKSHDIVSLLIGVNNQYQGLSFDDFKDEFDALLQTSISLALLEDGVFVVSIPDYGVTPFGSSNSQTIALELDQYNQYMSNKCQELGIPFIDITGISRTLGDGPNALAEDNLHPSGFQYSEWVKVILPFVAQIIE